MGRRRTQVVRVKREKLGECMTCPLCSNLLNDATTISECLHTFCRKCIYEKINDDEVDSCPVCNIDLGCAPLEKLRADHNLQDLRAKIFPSSRSNATADEVPSSRSNATENEIILPVPLPARRKERSLSSLVVGTPRVSSETHVMRKRIKSAGRKAPGSRDSTFSTEDPIEVVKDHPESSSSPVTLGKTTQNRRKNPTSTPKSSKQCMPNEGTDDGVDKSEGKADLWKPLNCLEEAASRRKYNKSNCKLGSSRSHANNSHVQKPKVRERNHKIKVEGDKNGSNPTFLVSVKPIKSNGVRRKKAAASEGLNVSAQAVVDAASPQSQRRAGPIWFSLVASEDQEGDAPLPQISSCFLRIRDGNIPVSFIKKYLVKKLNLQSEAEVEITLQGQPVLSTVELHNLVRWWSQTFVKPERVQTTVGSSAQDFVMALSYGRKSQSP